MAKPASSSNASNPTMMPPPALPLPTFSPLSDPVGLARISILLVPVGEVDKDRWDVWTKKIRGYTEIKLSDVPGTSGTTAKSGKARFLPPSFPPPSSSLHLSFITTPPPTNVLPLSLFRISACPLAVIGISDLSDPLATHSNQIEQFENALDEIGLGGSNGGIYPLAKRCFGIDEDVEKRDVKGYLVDEEPAPPSRRSSQETISRSATPLGTPRRVEQSSQFEGVVEIDASDEVVDPTVNVPNTSGKDIPMEGKKYYDRKGHEEKMVVIPKDGNVDLVLGMLMTDLCASVLTEFGEIATALESPAGTHALQSSLLPTLTLKPVPMGLTTAHRPKSGNWCHIAVTNNAAPVGGGAGTGRSPSPASSATSFGSPAFSSSQPNLLDQEGRDRVGPLRPASGMGSSNFTASPKAFTNTPLPDHAKAENRMSNGSSIKRSSSGFGFGSNVSRVLSGKGMGSGDSGSNTASTVATNGHAHTASTTGVSAAAGVSSSGSGRLKKLLGDLWLLSGRLSEAIASYSEAGVSLRSQSDTLWHGSAMEGLATASLLEAWEVRERKSDAVVPFTSSAILSNVHDNFNHAFTLYARAPRPPDSLFPHGHESGEGSIASLYVSCALKLTRTMLITWASGGFGTAALNALVNGNMPKVYPPMSYKSRWRVLLKLSTMSKISRNTVSRIASRAHGSFLAILPKAVQLDVFVTLVGINRLLGLDRREIYYAREAIGISLALILKGRLVIPAEADMTRGHGVELLTPSSRLDEVDTLSNTVHEAAGDVVVRKQESTEGNAGILTLIGRVLDIVGLSLSGSVDSSEDSARARLAYGWPEIQVEVLREAVSAAELLPDQDAVMQFSAMGLKYLVDFLSPAAQFKLHEIFTEAVLVSSRRGVARANDHWWLAGDLVTGMEILPIAPNRVPYEHASGIGKAETDPFLYNPRAKLANSDQATLVGNETFDVAVEVTNPFSFDLDIRSLSLVTSGVACEARPLRFVLPANTVQLVRLAGIAGETGRLNIDGCRVVLQDGAEKVISVPARHPSSPHKRERRRTCLNKGVGKTLGLNSRPGRQQKPSAETVEGRQHDETALVCDVIPPQPLLWIRNTSLVHGSVITHHGERSVIKLVLENTSALPVNFLKISFEDNTAVAGREILENGTLASAHAHQLGTDLHERPVLSIDQSDLKDVNILPGGTLAVTIHCLGKLGCEHASIDLDYGHVTEEPQEALYSRRISLPVLLTVHPALECGAITVIPWPVSDMQASSSRKVGSRESQRLTRPRGGLQHHGSFRQEQEATSSLRDELSGENQANKLCLVLMEVYNRSSVALEFGLERLASESDESSKERSSLHQTSILRVNTALVVRRLVAPGAVERIPIPLNRAWLDPESLTVPVPVFDKRQFVVPAHGAIDNRPEYLVDFWYRKHLISQLRGWWTNPSSSRAGEVVFLHTPIGGSGLTYYRASSANPILRVYNAGGDATGSLDADSFGVLELNASDRSENILDSTNHGGLIYRITVESAGGDPTSHQSGPEDGDGRHLLFDEPLDGDIASGGAVKIGFIALTGGTYRISAFVRSQASGELWKADPIQLHVR